MPHRPTQPNLNAENIDWKDGVLIYSRQKLGPFSEPARLTVSTKLRRLLESLPASGDFFPNIKRSSATDR
jgi:hypothetical protein